MADDSNILNVFLGPQTALVPVPRSAPLTEGALWPSHVIAGLLLDAGLGGLVLPCIRRAVAVPKSSYSTGRDRPNVATHYQSLAIDPKLIPFDQITLVDDVLTLGRTAFACALKLHETYPKAVIRSFAMVRTQGQVPDVERIVEPSAGTITCHDWTGWITRKP